MTEQYFVHINPDGTTQMAKVLRRKDYADTMDHIVGDGGFSTLLPRGDQTAVTAVVNEIAFLSAAVDLFNAEKREDRERDEALALKLFNVFADAGNHCASFDAIPYRNSWLDVAKAAREAIAAEAADA
jgi:hypothetical protein